MGIEKGGGQKDSPGQDARDQEEGKSKPKGGRGGTQRTRVRERERANESGRVRERGREGVRE